MSRGHSTLPRRTTLGRCRNKVNTNDAVILDVDKGKIDVVVVDAPETSHQGSRYLRTMKGMDCPNGIINIDDDDEEGDVTPGIVHGTTASPTFCHASISSPMSGELDDDECLMFFRKEKSPPTYQKMGAFSGGSPRNIFGLGIDSGSSCESDNFHFDISESDSSDCEIVEDFSGSIREQWERAAFEKRMSERRPNRSEDWFSASGSSEDPGFSSPGTSHNHVDGENPIDKTSKDFEEIFVRSSPCESINGKGNLGSYNTTLDEFSTYPSVSCKGKNSVSDLGPTPSIHHDRPVLRKAEELLSEHRAHYSNDPAFNCMRTDTQDKEMPAPGPSIYNYNVNRDGSISFQDKNEQFPVEPSFYNTETRVEASFQEKDGCCSVNSSISNFQTVDGTHDFPENVVFQEKEEQVIKESSCYTHCQHYSDVENDTARFQEKENPDFEELARCTSRSHPENGTNESTGKEELPQSENDLIGERERHKESAEYRRAVEEEWAARQRELQIQAEEVQRLRKRRKAESLRLLEMEKRQKQRIEEIRETQKKDTETINLKEQFRIEVRKELDEMEMRCRDMSSLLRALGINIEGGLFPLSREVNVAYKQALLRFHPDRASRTDIRQQVEAEEKFKLISRLKDRLLPVA